MIKDILQEAERSADKPIMNVRSFLQEKNLGCLAGKGPDGRFRATTDKRYAMLQAYADELEDKSLQELEVLRQSWRDDWESYADERHLVSMTCRVEKSTWLWKGIELRQLGSSAFVL